LHVHTDLTSLFIDCFEEGHYNPMADGRNANLFLCFQEFQYDSRTDVRLAGAWWPLYGENAAVEIQRNPACRFNTAFTVFYRAAFLLVYKPGLALHQQVFRRKVVAHGRQPVVIHFTGNAENGFPKGFDGYDVIFMNCCGMYFGRRLGLLDVDDIFLVVNRHNLTTTHSIRDLRCEAVGDIEFVAFSQTRLLVRKGV